MAIEFIKVREEQLEKLDEKFPMKNRVNEIYIDGDKIFFIEGQNKEVKTSQNYYLDYLEAQQRAMVNVSKVMKDAGLSSYQAADELRRLNEALLWEKKRQSELNRKAIQKKEVNEYLGYKVVRIDMKRYNELQAKDDVIYIIVETNQVVYKDKVIGEFDFVNQDIRECEVYDYWSVKEKCEMRETHEAQVTSTTGEYEGYMQTVNDFFKNLMDPLADIC